MSSDFNSIISKFHDQYKRIFHYYYPAHGSTGFTERNLSVNFARAIETTSSDTFAWYEVPLDRKIEHFDAMVVNMAAKEIYIIESKRFTNPKKKLKEVAYDIQRITNKNNQHIVQKKLKMTDIEEYTVYGVILADVWLETTPKKEIFKNWNETFFNEFNEELSLAKEVTTLIKETKWFTCGFEPKDIPEYPGDFIDYKNYKLLVMIFKPTP